MTRTQKEVLAQRQRIGELMGQIRDSDQTLQERLEGARSNLRFADKRDADLETQLLELQNQGTVRD